LTIAILVM